MHKCVLLPVLRFLWFTEALKLTRLSYPRNVPSKSSSATGSVVGGKKIQAADPQHRRPKSKKAKKSVGTPFDLSKRPRTVGALPHSCSALTQGCQIVLAPNIPKLEKIYQMTAQCTKRP
jgi:hypothetical protein